ncbi:MAG: ABC transporter permease subunit [Akkermansiaceae bacterium]|nr:ABC transporter permease subunit [Akkermansiaceae bacterium]
MEPVQNPFSQQRNSQHAKETAVKVTLILFTYTIIIAAIAIFGKIIYEGSPVLWQKGWSFFTKKPQTLFVNQVEKGEGIEIPAKNFEGLLANNPDAEHWLANVTEFEKPADFIQFDLLKNSRIGSGYLSELESLNPDFYIIYTERDIDSPVGFIIQSDKEFSLPQADYDALKAADPTLLPDEHSKREIKLNQFRITLAAGEYPIGKDAHDALVSTELVFQMRQTFADDEPDKINRTVIPYDQTITVSGNVYFTAFDEDERGTLPLKSMEQIPFTRTFHDFTLPASSYHTLAHALAILEKHGVQHNHDTAKGSIIVNENTRQLTAPRAFWDALTRSNPQLKTANVTTTTVNTPFVRFDISKDTEILLDTEDRESIAAANDATGKFKTTSEETHSYSGGGVIGPIIGTGLLVIICMLVALFTGIAASVFLNEYARKGGFVKTIRLAMLNLAGVPSIVFGLFGLGLFVILAPCVTSTPKSSSAWMVPLVKIGSQPDLRIIEQKQIYIAQHADLGSSELSTLAAADGAKHVYDGWIWLSLQGWGTSILAGGFTLAMMVLPVIITSCEESLRAVPMGFREASLALGASKWQSIRTAVLPYAFPGILTASVLGITRVAGETAPIMFTAAVAEKSELPWEGLKSTGFDAFLDFLQSSAQALPYHIYTVAGRIPQSEYTQPMQYGSVLVFMLIVMFFAAISVGLRIRVRKKLKW